ncbi:hypothetical protein BVX94_00480 [bacterium B17]|nr:hypothetical protein BVX94_00480 [bacterium B17]
MKILGRNRTVISVVLVAIFLLSISAVHAGEIISRDPYVSAIVADASNGRILYKENSEALVYPASVVKLMDLLIFVELIEKGVVKLTDKVSVTAEAAKIGGTQVWLEAGEEFTVDEMLYALMIKSANDVAAALAIHIAGTKDGFVKMMNKRAAELGMSYTEFNSVHGLPPSAGQKHDVTTARDIAILACEAARHPLVFRYSNTKVKNFREVEDVVVMRNHNRLLGKVEGCDGFKTGYIRVAGFSLASTVKRNDKRIVAVVMGSKFKETRDVKARELIETAFMKLALGEESAANSEYLVNRKIAKAYVQPVVIATEQKESPGTEKKKKTKNKSEKKKEESGSDPEPLSKRGAISKILAGLLLLVAGGVTTFFVFRRKHHEKSRDKYYW